MKTFLMNIPAVIRNFKNTMDIKALLCDDKSWVVFNDENRKIVYIFQRDNSLIISDNGEVSYASWQYINANSSLIIDLGRQSFMFHPTFVDDVLFALEQDGCARYMMMINEGKISHFKEITASALNSYLAEKEQEYIEDHKEEIKKQKRLEEQKQLEIQKEIEAKKQQEILDKKNAWEEKRKKKILDEYSEYLEREKTAYFSKQRKILFSLLGIGTMSLVIGVVLLISHVNNYSFEKIQFVYVALFTLSGILFFASFLTILTSKDNWECEQTNFINSKLIEEKENLEY